MRAITSSSLDDFKKDRRNYDLAEHYLRRSLEGIFTIGSHILSRLPAKTKDYRQIILSLGEYNIVPMEFAEKNKLLASYRNRLVHLYREVSIEKLYQVIKQHIDNISMFCFYYKEVVKDPHKFGLDV